MLLEDKNVVEHLLALLKEQSTGSLTERKRASSPYYSMAFQLKKFIDELPGGFLIYEANDEESIIYANGALVNIFKCKNMAEFKTLTGNSFKGIVYREDLERVENSISEQINNSHDALDYVEYRIKDKDGIIRWVEDYGHFVRTESSGNIFYVFIIDATEKITKQIIEHTTLLKQKDESEKKLQDVIVEYDKERRTISDAHLRRLRVIEGLSVNYESIAYANLETDEIIPYRLSTRFTKQFDEILQVRKFSEFVREYIDMWVHPDDKKLVTERLNPEYIKKLLSERKTYYMNYKCTENGEPRFLQLRLANVSDDDNVSHIVLGYRLIDDELLQEMKQRRLLKEALDTAKRASETQKTFLSNMSHDMRTPLNAIFGYTALAKNCKDDGEAVLDYVNKIEFSCRQLLDLIDMVLEISNAETSDLHINKSGCDIGELVDRVCESISIQAQKKNVTVNRDLGNLKHKVVITDGEKLKQLLTHVVNNAVKYNKNNGTVNLCVTETPSATSDFATFKFIVEDTGIGIDEEFLRNIFKPFERKQNTTESGVLGVGLGLTVAKRIADSLGGNIDIKSTVGEGSTFTVTLGLKFVEETEGIPECDEMEIYENLKNHKVLLVDDNEINLEIESELLEDLGLEVDMAENGKEALEKIAAAKPNEYLFVLMDIQMPVMDGRQATEEIRKLPDPAKSNVPIIALSANAFDRDKQISLEAGLDEHLTKPLDIPQLVKTVNLILWARRHG